MSEPSRIFISYAPEDYSYVSDLIKHLKPLVKVGKIRIWDESQILPRAYQAQERQRQLEAAQIVLVLVSADYFNDERCENEYLIAAALARDGKCLVVPILLRACKYDFLLEDRKVLPKNQLGETQAITFYEQEERDQIFERITEAVRLLIAGASYSEMLAAYDTGSTPSAKRVSNTNKNIIHGSSITANDMDIGDETAGRDLNKADTIIINNWPSSPSGRQETPVNSMPAFTLETVWQQFPLKKDIEGREMRIHDLDRFMEFERLIPDYADKASAYQNLFYFINCCKSQCPESIARRFVYFIREKSNKSAFPIDYARVSDEFYEVDIFDLKISMTREGTWENFWAIFLKKLSWGENIPRQNSEKQFNAFCRRASKEMKKTSRHFVVCEVNAAEWAGRDVSEHIAHIIERFSALPEDAHKFVFLFLMEMSNLHECIHDETNRVTRCHLKIKALCNRAYTCATVPHIAVLELLDYVHKDDVIEWLSALFETQGAKNTVHGFYEMICNLLYPNLSVREQQLLDKEQRFQMDRLYILQRYAYQHIKRHATRI